MPGALEHAWMLEAIFHRIAKLAAPSAVDSSPREEKISFRCGARCSPNQGQEKPKEIVRAPIRQLSLDASNIIHMHKISHMETGLCMGILACPTEIFSPINVLLWVWMQVDIAVWETMAVQSTFR